MSPLLTKPHRKCALLPVLAVCVVGALLGCSKEGGTAGAGGTNATTAGKTAALAPPSPGPGESTNPVPQSIFLGKVDPFYPNSGRLTEKAKAKAGEPAPIVNIADLLQKNLQGLIGTGSNRAAIINNVYVKANHYAWIPLDMGGGKIEKVRVYCREVLKTTVLLDVGNGPTLAIPWERTPFQRSTNIFEGPKGISRLNNALGGSNSNLPK